MEENKLVCPCDLFGRKAIAFHTLVSTLPGPVWIAKNGIERQINCANLIGILSLRIAKNDVINITYSKESTQEERDKVLAFFSK